MTTASLTTKITARDMIAAGTPRSQVAASLGVSVRTIGRWLEQLAADGDKSTAAAKPAQVKKPAKKKKKSKKTVTVTADSPEQVKALVETFNQQVDDDVEYRVLATRKSISLTRLVNGAVDDSTVVDKSSPTFDDIFKLIAESGMAQEALEKAYHLSQPKKMVEGFTKGKFKVDVVRGAITYTPDSGVPFDISGKLSARIIDTIKKDGEAGAETLFNFLDKLMLNPSNRSVNELYGFLQHNDIELAADGDFYAWKVVRSTYMDKHSNTMDNSVGKEVRVARNQVNEDSDVTCSYGLHVCAKSYISHFSSNGDRVVRVKVNPADVVAIPKDYNDSKMRCAGYFVESDVTDTFYKEVNRY
ncbi:hypothetical protein pf16_51 [Pseudomonas phage pf16]|uniref:RIIB protector from prophage-induced early lysis n=1 Tax=Pseudomonas phage pf16 TaxID=1815630 RepID=A0A1S5R3U0_9CAUD|nr:RIIB lysis inhibitor [Pseudomonas phage pf16]AND74974.1 hypothetical protein pf16_51 [Pseudomonas phage pf16]